MTDSGSKAPEAQPLEHSKRRWEWLLALIPLAWFLWTGARGLDFGEHWDEGIQIKVVQHSIEEETLLPGWYNYPSVSYWLSLVTLAPELLEADFGKIKTRGPLGVGRATRGLAPIQEQLLKATREPGFLLRMRGVFLSVSSLAILAVFFAARRRSGPWVALFAAGLLATSFEFAYHARWVAPDAILTAVVALYLCALLRAWNGGRSFLWAAALAGLATGTKYTGGLLLLPILLCVFLRRRELGQPLRRMLGIVTVFGSAFVISTPGALLQPVRFWRDVAFERFHYGEAGHYGFGVDSGSEHLALCLRWFGVELGSPYAPLALLVTLLALLGALATWRRDRREALLLLLLPVMWVLFFSSQKVLFVRNLLPMAPFFALFAARGLGALVSYLPARTKALTPALGLLLLLANGTWQYTAAESIRQRNAPARDLTGEFITWLSSERGERTVYLSEPLARELFERLGQLPPGCTTDRMRETDLAAFRPHEVALNASPMDPAGTLGSNLPGCLVASFGPREVNWEWYTTWREERLVVIERACLEPLRRSTAKSD